MYKRTYGTLYRKGEGIKETSPYPLHKKISHTLVNQIFAVYCANARNRETSQRLKTGGRRHDTPKVILCYPPVFESFAGGACSKRRIFGNLVPVLYRHLRGTLPSKGLAVSHMSKEQQVIFEAEFLKLNATKTSGTIRVPPDLVYQVIFRGLRVEIIPQEKTDIQEELPV